VSATNDLWAAAAPSRYPRRPVAVLNAPLLYGGSFRDRQSRLDMRWLRRYGGFAYEVPLVLLWSYSDYDYGSDWDGGDLWGCW
jgi:hypothetical protein